MNDKLVFQNNKIVISVLQVLAPLLAIVALSLIPFTYDNKLIDFLGRTLFIVSFIGSIKMFWKNKLKYEKIVIDNEGVKKFYKDELKQSIIWDDVEKTNISNITEVCSLVSKRDSSELSISFFFLDDFNSSHTYDAINRLSGRELVNAKKENKSASLLGIIGTIGVILFIAIKILKALH